MAKTIADLDTPSVLIDLDRVEANLKRAADHAAANGYKLRPHIKTHKLPRFAKAAVELGAVGITAQKLGEAEVMAEAGLTDIFLPYNIMGERKLARLKALNGKITLSVTADSPDTVAGYARTFTADQPLTVLVECDTGTRRAGVQSPEQALALARQIVLAPGLRFGGLMTYPPGGRAEEAEAWLREAVDLLTRAGIEVPRVTSGNTPDMWRTNQSVVTERRPGTYIYFDRTQVTLGAAEWDDCAITVLATVVSRPTPTRAILDTGSKSLSSDLAGEKAPGYGVIAGTDLVLARLNEEHGIIEMPAPFDTLRVGDRVRVVPNHACVVSNLFDEVHLVRGETVVETVPVAARGRVEYD
jgi:D-serine deaminase-like pyridoxal phosphate-dependent protein